MKHLFTIIYFISFTVCLYADGVYFNHFDAKGKLPQINIMSIYQDETGAMWFGTSEGICRYNGIGTQIFNSSDKDEGLTQNIIYSISGSRKGAIYIKANYDLVRYDIVKGKFENLKRDNVRAIHYRNNILWFASDHAIFQYSEETGEIIQYTTISKNNGRTTSLYITESNEIWIGTTNGLMIIPSHDNKIEKHIKNVLENIHISTIFVDSKQNFWIGTFDSGIHLLNRNAQKISYYKHIPGKPSLSNDQIRTILEDNLGKIWIGTFFGLNSFDLVTQQWSNYIQSDNQSNSISHSSIFSLYKDVQGTLWIGTYFGGVNYYNPESDIFKFYSASSSDQNHLSFPFIGRMTEDNDNNLWICTEGGGLNCLNLKTRKISRYLYEGYNFESTKNYNLKCIWYDKNTDKLYIGIHNGGLCIFDIKTKKSKILTHDINNKLSLPNNAIRELQYYNGMLYILTAQGLCRMDIESENFHPVSDDPSFAELINRGFIYSFYIDSKDRIWLSSWKLTNINLITKEAREFIHEPDNKHSFSKFRATSIYETKAGDILLASEGSGLFLYRPDTDDFMRLQDNINKEIGNFCYYMTETNSGNLILLSNKGVTIIDLEDKNKILYQSSQKFPLTRFFLGSSAYITNKDEIFIGGINGLVSVFESQLMSIGNKEYNLYFDKLYLNDKRILPDDKSRILEKELPMTKEIKLKYNQNNISIEFASSDYLQNTEKTYEYKLEGFDEKWIPATSNLITYTNIDHGKYKLLLKEKQADPEIKSEKVSSLLITITPPFYKTIYAYIFYTLVILLALFGVFRFLIWRSNLQTTIEFERREKERNENLTQMKLRFFTNISHELRTPLTLIIGQIDVALKSKNMTEIQNRISKAHLNAVHMRNLISELLDFRKQEQGYYMLKIEKVELVEFIREIYDSFQEYALQHNITFNYIYDEDEIYVYIDPPQFKKAINNLLSNAFKYTSPEGEITIRIKTNDKISILVEDNGIGIPQKSLNDIFQRFYQVEHRSSGFSLGTGIGLALTKEIVNSHKGEITVESTINKGSIFNITLLKGKEHFTENLISESENNEQKSLQPVERDDNLINIDIQQHFFEEDEIIQPDTDSKYSILIVEDNEELLEFLRDSFSKTYKTYIARNGKEGLDMTLDIHPDLVLSDVMMPEMSGKEMCYKIKNNLNISHIPVVLLTAQDSQAQTVEGYMFGADDYITKPFDIEVLLSRCNSIVRNRHLLYQNITKQKDSIVTFNILEEEDRKFIEKTTSIIRANFDNPNFDMNMLASELNLGRNKLYTRIKDLTNLTPNEFTLNIKLKEALYLLDNYLHLNISEIAFQLGFSSSKYFSKCFKTFYGISPLQWRKDRHGDKYKE